MGIIVRRLRKRDVFKVSSIVRRNQRKVLIRYYPKKLIEAFCRVNYPKSFLERSKNRRYFVAEDKKTKRILGIIGIEKNEVKTFNVDPKYHGKGIGRLLNGRFRKEALKRGYKKVFARSSLYAVNVYKKLGFKTKGRKYRAIEGIRFYDVVMEARLK